MFTFKDFLLEKENMEGNINTEGNKAIRHMKNYVLPYLSKNDRRGVVNNFSKHKINISDDHGEHYTPDPNAHTHELSSDYNNHKAGTPIKVVGAHHDASGKIILHTKNHGEIPQSRVKIPEKLKKSNITKGGFEVEDKIAKNLGGTAAGSTGAAYDYTYKGKEGGVTGKVRKIENDKPYLRGESKQNKANMGVSTIKFDKDKKKWHITNEGLRDTFSKAKHPVSGLSLLDHVNKFHKDGIIEKSFNVAAAKGTARTYLNNLGVNSLHLHRTEKAGKKKAAVDHGTTYTIGDNNDLKNKTKMGHLEDKHLDRLDGNLVIERTTTGTTRISHKPNYSTFREYADNSVKNPNSHVDLTKEDHATLFKSHIDAHISKKSK